ncbi:MAG: hypothetical protein A3H98_14335 [Bacteroidetes bacterium RIFCSPLOWO2_02_FULL_36_8]|nr:MAG: hypothetical protein A3H98_14335 [Bacteroidetes bacterium RIFCSPLOWO2_02_FULL_36_8]OFY71875.1 MAG: hypothetical protein A3G23_04945 [Bacteroidetes bacterium RIFCSPLOWO2_12_FULL_37_12]
MKKKFLFALISLAILFSILFTLRFSILRSMGDYLKSTDPHHKTKYLFVLSGGAIERGESAAKLFHQGIAEKIICTGRVIPQELIIVNNPLFESHLTKMWLERKGVPDSAIYLLEFGTSTMEESRAMLEYCQKNKITEFTVLSSIFHTRRVRWVFKDFKNYGITVYVAGSPANRYDENFWWQSEDGLLMVNNEYMKLMYYWLNY